MPPAPGAAPSRSAELHAWHDAQPSDWCPSRVCKLHLLAYALSPACRACECWWGPTWMSPSSGRTLCELPGKGSGQAACTACMWPPMGLVLPSVAAVGQSVRCHNLNESSDPSVPDPPQQRPQGGRRPAGAGQPLALGDGRWQPRRRRRRPRGSGHLQVCLRLRQPGACGSGGAGRAGRQPPVSWLRCGALGCWRIGAMKHVGHRVADSAPAAKWHDGMLVVTLPNLKMARVCMALPRPRTAADTWLTGWPSRAPRCPPTCCCAGAAAGCAVWVVMGSACLHLTDADGIQTDSPSSVAPALQQAWGGARRSRGSTQLAGVACGRG